LRLVGKKQLFTQLCFYLQFSVPDHIYFPVISKLALFSWLEVLALARHNVKSRFRYHSWPSENWQWGQSCSKIFVAGRRKLCSLHLSPGMFTPVLAGHGSWVLLSSLEVLWAQHHSLRHCDLSVTSFPEFHKTSPWPLFPAPSLMHSFS